MFITCGPSWVPVDAVRRITNFSSGELGTVLSDRLTDAGFEVVCFRGESATHPQLPRRAEVVYFRNNEDLLHSLEVRGDHAWAVLHAAALSDFEVESVACNGDSIEPGCGKIPSRGGPVDIRLRPAMKVLPLLRGIFPSALLVGWKYETDNPRRARAAARRQLLEAQTDLCVLNGPVLGHGFEIHSGGEAPLEISTRPALADWFAHWLLEQKTVAMA